MADKVKLLDDELDLISGGAVLPKIAQDLEGVGEIIRNNRYTRQKYKEILTRFYYKHPDFYSDNGSTEDLEWMMNKIDEVCDREGIE